MPHSIVKPAYGGISLNVASTTTEKDSWTLATDVYPLTSVTFMRLEMGRYGSESVVFRRIEICLRSGNVAIAPDYGTTPVTCVKDFATALYNAVA